jgi:hypothetical protein
METLLHIFFSISLTSFLLSVLCLFGYFYFSFRSAKKREIRKELTLLRPEMFRREDPARVAQKSIGSIVDAMSRDDSVEVAKEEREFFGRLAAKTLMSRFVIDGEFKKVLFEYVADKRTEFVLPRNAEYIHAMVEIMHTEFGKRHRGRIFGFARRRLVQGYRFWLLDRVLQSRFVDAVLSKHEHDFFHELTISLLFLSDNPASSERKSGFKRRIGVVQERLTELSD